MVFVGEGCTIEVVSSITNLDEFDVEFDWEKSGISALGSTLELELLTLKNLVYTRI